MSLTQEERLFLDAYVVEATDGPPFGGPATADLKVRGIFYSDLSWILTAYDRERCARRMALPTVRNPNPPTSPWKDLEQVKQRNQILRLELEARAPVASAK